MSKFQVIGIGSPIVDILSQVDDAHIDKIRGDKGGMELVESQEMEELLSLLSSHEQVSGGSAANTIVGLSQLGFSSTLLGKIGDCEMGKFYRKNLQNSGVDHARLKVCTESLTGKCLSMITPDAERTLRTCLGAAGNLSADEVSVDDFKGVDHAHIEGYVLFNRELTEKVLDSAKAAGCSISLDLASFEVVKANEDILDYLLMKYVDMVFANEEEATAYCGSTDPDKALEKLSRHCATAVVKLGPDGAILANGNEKVRVEAQRVTAIDTTGAGDLWAAGFLYGRLSGKDLVSSAQYGARLGAEVVQIIGASISEDRWNDIRKIVK
ncbi:MAG: adenosine kinase [Lentisphaeria bacterium]|nr:adenosine kinase [Lentisphaeria bacterium]NQZ71067.1 adenosine kinase [Lentisphaeria bacterium]